MDVEMITGNYEFKIFTGLLKASRTPDGRMHLHGVASSTTKDLHGDTILASAIDDMEQAANNNLTIFLNHSYNVPEDVGGSVEKAHSITRGVDHEGNPNIDLNLDIAVNDTNPRAVKTFEAIERGTKLGLSIGAMIPDGGARRQKDGTYLIDHVNLLETSIVGIPANPRSWVEYAVKSITKAKDDRTATVPLGSPTLTLSDNNYKIEGSLESTNIVWDALSPSATATTGYVETTTTASDTNGFITWSPAGVVTTTPLITETNAATCPTCGGSKGSPRGDCSNSFHDTDNDQKSAEPDVTDAQVTIIQIDTSDGDSSDASDDTPRSSQDAPSSSPDAEDGLADETAEGDDAALGDTVTDAAPPLDVTSFTQTLALLTRTTRDLIDARAELATVTAALETERTARRAAETERSRVLAETKRILDKVADSPLVRRAVVVDAQQDLSRFAGIYSDNILKQMEQRNTNG